MILGIAMTVMTVAAIALVVLPLIRGNRESETRAAHEIEIYRDQLDEVDRDVARGVIGPDEAEAALSRRFAIIQVWRSIAPRVESEPLALCDGRTIPEVGFIRNQRRYRDRTADSCTSI